MTKITAINGGKPDPEVIRHLEHLMGMAKAGELRGIGYVCVCENGSTMSGYQTTGYARDVISMQGEISVLNVKLATLVLDNYG